MIRNRVPKISLLNALFIFIATLNVLIAFPVPAQQAGTGQPSAKPSLVPVPTSQAAVFDNYGKLSLSFEANRGQADARVKFLSRTSGYSLFLTGDEAVLVLRGGKTNTNKWKVENSAHTLESAKAAPAVDAVLRMKLRNANSVAKVTGVDELAGTSNYFIGNDPAKWRTNVPTYKKVKYERIYSGIDLIYYGNQQQLEYDFIVSPGADPRRIEFEVRGAETIRRDALGDLVLKISEGEIRWHKPIAYQEKHGTRQEVAAHYSITAANRVGFEVAEYDTSKPLYIDPLIYSTYLGGSDYDFGYAIAVDSTGNAYVTGKTYSSDFPTKNPLQGTLGGGPHAFVAKLDPTGSALVYSTYLGGNGSELGSRIVADSAGNAYVTGTTYSTDFPTMNPLQPTNGGASDAFVAKIDPTGSALAYSTYLGGNGDDSGSGITVDSAGNAYVDGYTGSTDFPTKNPLQAANAGSYDAFVAKIDATGSALIYSTYLGGGTSDYASGIAVDSAGNAYVNGTTASGDFPTKNPLQAATGGNEDTFVAKINPTGSALVYSTYLGGSGNDIGEDIAIDSAGRAYVIGLTDSTDFPTKNPLQAANAGGSHDAFVAKINALGTALVYSTYLGGSADEYGTGIVVDSAGSAYVTGITASLDFPTKNPFQAANAGGDYDAFLAKLNATGTALDYSTYLGGSGDEGQGSGIAIDSTRNIYLSGATSSTHFPTKKPMQAAKAGAYDAFIAKIDPRAATTTTLSSSPNPSTYGQVVTFTSGVSSPFGAPPDGETVTFKQGSTVLGTGTLSSGSASLSTTAVAVGTRHITAVYAGDANFTASTTKLVSPQVVDKATTTTTLISSQNPSSFNQSVTFTATVAPEFSGMPSGAVTFMNGTATLATRTLSNGVARFTVAMLNVGTQSITVAYNGSGSFLASTSNAVSQVVKKATTTMKLVSSLNPSKVGQSVSFTATVTGQFGGLPTGTVTLKDGTTTLGTFTLTSRVAHFTTATLASGTHNITATYNGSLDFTTSSALLTQTVN
jgi:hypothetical protein